MGQYKQWLHYREIDRQLHTQLKQLEDEFVRLQIQLDAQAAAEPGEQLSDNAIVQALARSLQERVPTPRDEHYQPTSPAPQDTSAPFPASIPHPELTLFPEDMATFMQQHTLKTPSHTPPWWLDTLIHPVEVTRAPVDSESVRTNDLVERWFERWRGQPDESQEATEDQS